ncbi:MAG: phage tail assembly protein [Rhodospirillales bacterium]|nr:phage tail assembly protein [Rhodospirillales bacterium]
MSKYAAPKPTTVTLRHPVEVDGVENAILKMRPPRARDSADAQRAAAHPSEVEVRLFANLCEVSEDIIGALHMVDYVRIQSTYADYMEGVRPPTL